MEPADSAIDVREVRQTESSIGQDITRLNTKKERVSQQKEENGMDLVERMRDIILKTDKRKTCPNLDERRFRIYEDMKKKFQNAPKSVLQQAEEKKPKIERQLEDSEKKLDELLTFGSELVTNIKVANEKRELLRRENENACKELLQADLRKESVEAMARFNDITSKWSELEALKEPMSLYEELEKQKQSIAELMKSKDDIIEQCQREIDRVNAKYNADQQRQANDVCCLVERIDAQIELIKTAYKEHMELLQNTIEDERQNIALTASTKWDTFYDTMLKNEKDKLAITKEKEKFYEQEIERISEQQEEITRNTRIRLEKDAELLEWELRSIKNNVLLNSEKLDYNYQVLQKRNEENVVINNQQKRRVAKLHEGISVVKKKINSSTINAESTMRRLSNDIQKLHGSISELEKKSQYFRRNNKRKFDRVWDINYKEIKELLTKVFEIDRILHEQQLATTWTKPDVELQEIRSSEEMVIPMATTTTASVASNQIKRTIPSKNSSLKVISKEEKLAEVRLLRNILRKIADRAGFLVEERLLKILEPYSEEEQCLVRIDNIFAALRIRDIKTIASLTKYFKPYAFCPNCSEGISKSTLETAYTLEKHSESEQSAADHSATTCKFTDPSPKTSEHIECNQHYLVIEPALVLTSLNDFTGRHAVKKTSDIDITETGEKAINLIKIDNAAIQNYWRKFADYMPPEKRKLWNALEHGLNHYLEVLKQRSKLYNECVFLRGQNKELKYLLQKFKN